MRLLPSFYLVRHGQSQANADGTPAGIIDSPLTAQGRKEAEEIRMVVEALPVKPERIVTSALSRAKDTAAIINRNLGLPVEEEPLLNEQDYGIFQGVSKTKIIAEHGHDWSVNPEGGESFDAFTDRVVTALENILTRDARLTMIVGHGGMAHALGRRHNLGLRGVKNCALMHFRAESEGGAPWCVLDHSGAPFIDHLPAMASS